MRTRVLLNFFVVFIFFSCSTKKNIIYLQDIDENANLSYKFYEYKLKIDDILKIDVSFETAETSFLFNQNQNINSNNKDSYLYEGFQVDSKGNISYPQLGNIYVEGMSVDEVKELIQNELITKKILVNPSVDVKLINAYFTVLGEVNIPGRHEFLKNNLNVLEALGMAGDLTINGKRNDIKVLRNQNGSTSVINLNLTNSKFVYDNFQIFSGDIIIVNPNSNRVKNAGIIGNSGTLLTLLSFILSSIIVINN